MLIISRYIKNGVYVLLFIIFILLVIYNQSDSKEKRVEYLKQNLQVFEQLAHTLVDLKHKGIKKITFKEVVPTDFLKKGVSLLKIQQIRKQFKALDIDYGYSAYGTGDTFYLITRRLFLSKLSQGYSYISPPSTIDFNCKKSAIIRCNSEEFYTYKIINNWYIYQK